MGFTARDRRNYGTMNLSGIARLEPGVAESQLRGVLN